jgi:hypothetical protein
MTTPTMRQSKLRQAKSVFAWSLNDRTAPGIGQSGIPDCRPCLPRHGVADTVQDGMKAAEQAAQ